MPFDVKANWQTLQNKNIQLQIEPYQLPTAIQMQIHKFMHELGIVFGVFDFIVTEDDKYVFLEVNEQGQFLWLENYHQDFPMLDIFMQFITNKSMEFTWKPEKAKHSLADYIPLMEEIYSDNIKKHIELNHTNINRADVVET